MWKLIAATAAWVRSWVVPSDGTLLAEAHNRQRRSRGLSELAISAGLAAVAQSHASWMARTSTLSHIGQGGSRLGDRLRRGNYRYSRAGENIARGQLTVDRVMAAWLGSAGHRQNILHPEYTEIGCASAVDGQGRKYWVVVFATPTRAGVAGMIGTPELTPPPLEEHKR